MDGNGEHHLIDFIKKKKSMCREFNAKIIVWCLTKTRFPSCPCFVYGLWNVPLGKIWSLFVCLVKEHAKKKKKTRRKWVLCKPMGPCGLIQGFGQDGSCTLFLLAALQAASRWEKSAPFSCLHSQTPPTALFSGSKPPTVKLKKKSRPFPTFPALSLRPTFLGTL